MLGTQSCELECTMPLEACDSLRDVMLLSMDRDRTKKGGLREVGVLGRGCDTSEAAFLVKKREPHLCNWHCTR